MASPDSEGSRDSIPDPLEHLEGLEPLATFECHSGVLLWGQLDMAMEAKLKLDDGQYDGCPANSGEEAEGHRFKCRAAKGKWNKLSATVGYLDEDEGGDQELFVFYCHEGIAPRSLVDLASQSSGESAAAPRVVYVKRYEWTCDWQRTVYGDAWKSEGGYEVLLTDPCWDITLPRQTLLDPNREEDDDEEESGDSDKCDDLDDNDDEAAWATYVRNDFNQRPSKRRKLSTEDEEKKRPSLEDLLDRLLAKYGKRDDRTYSLEHDSQACGLISTDFNFDQGPLEARLVFNGDQELIGMGFNRTSADACGIWP